MTSLRHTALIWMTALLTVVGVLAFFVSYALARREAADFLDGQLRQIALNAGIGLANAEAPGAKHDPEDEFVIAIWNPAGEALRNSPNGSTWRVFRNQATPQSKRMAKTGASTWLATPAVRFRWRNA